MAQKAGEIRAAIGSVEELKAIIAQYCLGDQNPRPDVLVDRFLGLIYAKIKKAKNNEIFLDSRLGTDEHPENITISSILKQLAEYLIDDYTYPDVTEDQKAGVQALARDLKFNTEQLVRAGELLKKIIDAFGQKAEPTPATEKVVPDEIAVRIRKAFQTIGAEEKILGQLLTAYTVVVDRCYADSEHNEAEELTLPPELRDTKNIGDRILQRLGIRPQVEIDAETKKIRHEAEQKLSTVRDRVRLKLALSLTQSTNSVPPFFKTLQDAINDISVIVEAADQHVSITQPDDLAKAGRQQRAKIILNRLFGNVIQLHPTEIHFEPTDEQLLGFAQQSLTIFLDATGPIIAAHDRLIKKIFDAAQAEINGEAPAPETAPEMGTGEAEATGPVVPVLTPEQKAAEEEAKKTEGLGERKKQLMKLHELQEKLTNVAEGALVEELINNGFSKVDAQRIANEHHVELAQQLWARLLNEGAQGDMQFTRAVVVMDGVVQEARQFLLAQYQKDTKLQSITPLSTDEQTQQAERLADIRKQIGGDTDSVAISLRQLEQHRYDELLNNENAESERQLQIALAKLGLDTKVESEVREIIAALRAAGNGEYFSRDSLQSLLIGLGNRDQAALAALQQSGKAGNLTIDQYNRLTDLIDKVREKGWLAALEKNPLTKVPIIDNTAPEDVKAALQQLLAVAGGQDFIHIAQRAERLAENHEKKEDFLIQALEAQQDGNWWQQLSPDQKASLAEKLRFRASTVAALRSGQYQVSHPTEKETALGKPTSTATAFLQQLRTDPRTQAGFAFLMYVMNDPTAPPQLVANFSTHMYLLQEGIVSYDTFTVMVQGIMQQTAREVIAPDGQYLDWTSAEGQAAIAAQSANAAGENTQRYTTVASAQQQSMNPATKAKIAAGLVQGPAGWARLLSDKQVRNFLATNAKRLAIGLLAVSIPPIAFFMALPQIIAGAVVNVAINGVGSGALGAAGAMSAGQAAGAAATAGLQGGSAIAANAAPTVQAATSLASQAAANTASNALASAQVALQTGMTQAASMTMTIPLVAGIFVGGLAMLATLTIIVITVIGGSLNDLPMGTGGSNALLPLGDTGCLKLDQNSFLSAQQDNISPTQALSRISGQAAKLMQSPLSRALCQKIGTTQVTIVYDVGHLCGDIYYGCVLNSLEIRITPRWAGSTYDPVGVFTIAHEMGHVLAQKTNYKAAYQEALGPKEIPTYPFCGGYSINEWIAEALGLTIYTAIYPNSNNPYAAKASCASWYKQTINNYNIRIDAPNVVQFIEGFLR